MDRTPAWPSQSAITEVSTPACSSDMAQLCRRTCGWTRLPGQGRASLRGGRGVGADPQRDGVAAEPSAGPGGEQRVAGRPARSVSQPLHDACDRAGEGHGSLFAAFAFAGDVGAGAEGDVAAVQADEFGDPQPGLDGQQHQGSVASAFPAGLVGRGDQRVDLGGGQERHDPLVEPFRRDRQDALDQQRMLGMAQSGDRRTATGSRSGERCGSGCCCAARFPGG